jgi:hypothetical protein
MILRTLAVSTLGLSVAQAAQELETRVGEYTEALGAAGLKIGHTTVVHYTGYTTHEEKRPESFRVDVTTRSSPGFIVVFNCERCAAPA